MPAKPLNQQNNMPQMRAAFAGWTSKITLEIIKQTIVDGLVDETRTKATFSGTVQPLTDEQLLLKPEGERSWQWLMIHCVNSSLTLETQDKIVFNGVLFKVVAIKDYRLNNYIEYHVVKDFDAR